MSTPIKWTDMAFSENEELDRINDRNTREHIPVIVFVAVIITVGVIVNIFATIFYCCKVQKSPFQKLMFCLSFNDLITNFVLIERFVELFYNAEYRGSALCQLFYVLRHFLAGNSLLLMVAIGFDRYRRVCFPFSKQITVRAVWYILAGFMAFSFAVSVRYFVTVEIVVLDIKTESNSTVGGHYCLLSPEHNSVLIEGVFHYVDICTHGIITFLLVFFYSLVVRKLIKSRQKVNVNKKGKTATHNKKVSSISCTESPKKNDLEMSVVRKDDVNSTRGFSQSSSTLNFTLVSSKPHSNCKTDSDISGNAKIPNILSTNDLCLITAALNPNEADTGRHVKDRPKSSNSTGFKTLQRRLFVSRLEKRMAVMAAVITVVSFVCIVPYYVSVLTEDYNFAGNGLLLNADVLIARNAYMLNSAINPFIILGFSVAFRRFLVNTFCLVFQKGRKQEVSTTFDSLK